MGTSILGVIVVVDERAGLRADVPANSSSGSAAVQESPDSSYTLWKHRLS